MPPSPIDEQSTSQAAALAPSQQPLGSISGRSAFVPSLCLPQVRTGDRFSTLEQGLLIRQLAREDAGIYQCQAMERAFSRPLTHYSLRVIGHEAMGAKRSKGAEEGGSHLSAVPMQLQYKGYPRTLGAPGTSLDEYCNALRHQERQRQKAWNPKWQQHSLESKKGRVRRHPNSLKPARAGLRLV